LVAGLSWTPAGICRADGWATRVSPFALRVQIDETCERGTEDVATEAGQSQGWRAGCRVQGLGVLMRGGVVRWEAEEEDEVGQAGGGLQKKQPPQQVLPPPNVPMATWRCLSVFALTNLVSPGSFPLQSCRGFTAASACQFENIWSAPVRQI